ncbi:MAG: hypothetical protein ACHQHN_10200 [Sphingobacteriales bacterium]
MHSEAKETARLYVLLTDKLGSDTTEAMFNYIDNKTVQSVEATIKTLATKDDLHKELGIVKDDLHKEIGIVKDDLAKFKYDISRQIGDGKADTIKWMFIFWIGQVGATLAILFLFLKK